MLIYKIFRKSEWADLCAKGQTTGAPADVADGYIHFSTADQAATTAAKHFSGEVELTLLAIEADAMGEALKWEPSRGAALFPHLYRQLKLTDVAWSCPLPLTGGKHQFPAVMT